MGRLLVVAGLLDDVQFDDLLLEQAQAPTGKSLGSRRAGQSDQFRLRRAIENPSVSIDNCERRERAGSASGYELYVAASMARSFPF